MESIPRWAFDACASLLPGQSLNDAARRKLAVRIVQVTGVTLSAAVCPQCERERGMVVRECPAHKRIRTLEEDLKIEKDSHATLASTLLRVTEALGGKGSEDPVRLATKLMEQVNRRQEARTK